MHAAAARTNRAADRGELFDEKFLKTLECLLWSRARCSPETSAPSAARARSAAASSSPTTARTRAATTFRYIDWNLYGRLDRLLLRLFEEEEDLYIYILVDCSDSMSIGSPLPKLHYAMQVGAALTYVGLANLDRVSIVPFGDKLIDRMPPSRGKNRIFRVFEFLSKIELGGKTELADCMKDFVAQNKRRGLAVVISDFYDPRGFEQGINTLRYNKFEPFVLQVYDKEGSRAEPARRSRTGRLRDRRCQGSHDHEEPPAAVHGRAREVLPGARELLHEARDAVLPHAHRDPVRRARAEDLPQRRLSPGDITRAALGSLTLYVAAGAAALVVGAYILKMRRRRFEVPLAQLWKRVLQEKDATSLWKHLKRLLSLLFILADPRRRAVRLLLDPDAGAQSHEAHSIVILLDASGSMKAMDGNDSGTQTRMDAAKQAADKLIDSFGGGDVAMIMKVDGQATPLSRFTNDGPMLHAVLHGGLHTSSARPRSATRPRARPTRSSTSW